MKKNSYKCAMCKRVFKDGWSEKSAIAEATATWGKSPYKWKSKPEKVCDDCYNLVMKHPNIKEMLEESKKRI